MARRRLWALIGLGIGTLVTPTLYDEAAGGLMTLEVRHALGSMSGLSIDTVSLTRDRNAVLLDGIRLQAPNGALTIGRATVRRPSVNHIGLMDAAAAASASLALDDIRLTFGKLAVVVPHAEASGSPLMRPTSRRSSIRRARRPCRIA